VASGHVEEWIVLESAFDASHENHLEVWLGVEFGEQFTKGVEKDHLPGNSFGTGKDVWCAFDG
jgi:hypothetical protein